VNAFLFVISVHVCCRQPSSINDKWNNLKVEKKRNRSCQSNCPQYVCPAKSWVLAHFSFWGHKLKMFGTEVWRNQRILVVPAGCVSHWKTSSLFLHPCGEYTKCYLYVKFPPNSQWGLINIRYSICTHIVFWLHACWTNALLRLQPQEDSLSLKNKYDLWNLSHREWRFEKKNIYKNASIWFCCCPDVIEAYNWEARQMCLGKVSGQGNRTVGFTPWNPREEEGEKWSSTTLHPMLLRGSASLRGSSLNAPLGGAVAPPQRLLEASAAGRQRGSRLSGNPPLRPLRRRTDLQFNKSQCRLFSFYTFSWQRKAGTLPSGIAPRTQRRPYCSCSLHAHAHTRPHAHVRTHVLSIESEWVFLFHKDAWCITFSCHTVTGSGCGVFFWVCARVLVRACKCAQTRERARVMVASIDYRENRCSVCLHMNNAERGCERINTTWTRARARTHATDT